MLQTILSKKPRMNLPSLKEIPLINIKIKEFDQEVKNLGFQQSMVSLVKKSATKLKITGKKEALKNILKYKPVIVVANRPFYIDPIVLVASLEDRNDIFSITNSYFTNISANLDAYLIPVYIRHHLYPDRINLLGKLMDKLHPQLHLSPQEEHRKNIKSIKDASLKVSRGGLVIIFPTSGRKGNDKKWFKGIGYLIKGLKKDCNCYLVKAYLEENYNYRLDYLRVLPLVCKIIPAVNITFAAGKKLKEIVGHEKDAAKITSILEKDYNDWVFKLKQNKSKINSRFAPDY